MDQTAYLMDMRASKINSAFYLYSTEKIEENFARFESVAYPNTDVFFASMANDNPHLLTLIRERGMGLFVNSLKHLRLAESCGFPADRVIFASTGLTAAMMRYLVARGIKLHLDSISQIELFGTLGIKAEVGLRLNTSERSRISPFSGNDSRIGIQDHELDEALDACERLGLTATGSHVYIGTDIVDVDEMIAGVERSLELSHRFPDLAYVDVGGGFPLDETRFDFDDYNARITALLTEFSKKRGRPIRLVIEPGRAMFGNAACFYAQVTDIKKRDGHYFVCVDASASMIPRAMFYEDYNPVRVMSNGGGPRPDFDQPVDVVGNTTYSRDFLTRRQTIPQVEIGEWLEFDQAGSYCYSMITRFLGQTFPPEYLASKSGGLTLIRPGDVTEEAVQ